MTAVTGTGPPSDATLMTLAGIAYGYPTSIPGYLTKAVPTTGWSVVWMPEVSDAPPNFMFLATDGAGQFVVAIRGTYPNPLSSAYWDDGAQDSPFGDMVLWPGTVRAKIGKGTDQGQRNLWALADATGKTLIDVVAALPDSAHVTVTGHSLGGTQTPVIALKLVEANVPCSVSGVSFAGLTPGNADFARLFGAGTPLNGKVRRVYNTQDSVSYGWDNVWGTHRFYQPAPKGGWLVKLGLLYSALRLRLGGYHYTAIGSNVALTGIVRPPRIKCQLVAYITENLHQHMPDTYLALLGAPPLPFSILWGTVLAPRGEEPKMTDGVIHLDT